MKNNFSFERYGCNIIGFYNNTCDIIVALEYDFEKGKFKAFSDYAVTKHFVYHGRNYDRTKGGNREIYLKVLRMVKPFLSEAIKGCLNV